MSRPLLFASAITIGFTLSAPVAAQTAQPNVPVAKPNVSDAPASTTAESELEKSAEEEGSLEASTAENATPAAQGTPEKTSQPQMEPAPGPTETESSENAEPDSVMDARSTNDEHANEAEEEPKETYDGPATLLDGDGGKMHIGGYGGLAVLGTSINKSGGLLVGGEGALLLDHRLAIGIAGYGLASEVKGPDFANGDDSILGFGYGGAVFRYHLVSKRSPVTASLGTLLGAGGLTLIEKASSNDFDYEYDSQGDTQANVFFIAEPSVQVNLHLTQWMRFGVSGGYRFVRGPSLGGISDSDLEGVTAGAHAQFGWF